MFEINLKNGYLDIYFLMLGNLLWKSNKFFIVDPIDLWLVSNDFCCCYIFDLPQTQKFIRL